MGNRTAVESECRGPFEGGPEPCDYCNLRIPRDGLRRCRRMVAESATMRALLRRARMVAESDAPAVLLGETGTGKEVLGRAIHATSARADGPFVAVNCGAIPSELLESEFFGHARGAYTGAATDKAGLFEEASGGTMLLDEIAELPLALQVKLLRVLQDGEVRRLGETRARAFDVRVLAATHRDLRDRVGRESFREDLYYRLKVFSLHLPPLRDRREDLLPMARQFLELEGRKARRFAPAAERAMLDWSWPGNCRELENAARHGAAMAEGEEVRLEDLPEELHGALPMPATSGLPVRLASLRDAERAHVLGVLTHCEGNQAAAARILGIGRNTLWRKLEAWHRAGLT